MVNLANRENNRIMKENNYIESAQLSKSIFPEIMEKIIIFTRILDNLYSDYIQLKYKQEINSLQKSVLKNRIDQLSEEYDHSIKRKQINEDLIQERTILRARITTQNRELDLAKSNNLLLKQNIQSIILNFNHIRNIHVEYKYTPDEFLRAEIGNLKAQGSIMGEENRRLLSEIKGVRNNLKSLILDEQLQRKGLLNTHIQRESLMKLNTINLKSELINHHEQLQQIKTYHVIDQPNDYLRKEILDLRIEKSIMQEHVEQLNENFKLSTLNLKSIISQTSVHSTLGDITHDILFLKSNLEVSNTHQKILKQFNNKIQQTSQTSSSIVKHKLFHNNEKFKSLNKAKYTHQITANIIFRKQILQELIEQGTIMRIENNELNEELMMTKCDKLNLKEKLEDMRNFHQLGETHTEYKNKPDEFLRMEIGDLHEQGMLIGAENSRLLSEIKDIRNHLKSLILEEHLQRKGLINIHAQEKSQVAYNLINLKSDLSNQYELLQQIKIDHVSYKFVPDEYIKEEAKILNEHNSALRVKNNQLNELVDILKDEIDRLNEDKINLKSSFLLSLPCRNTDLETGGALSNRLIKIKYEDLISQHKLLAENMNNKIMVLNDANNRLKHTIIIGNERLKARKITDESLVFNDEIFRKQIVNILDENTENNQRIYAQIEHLKKDKILLKSLLFSLKEGNLPLISGTTDTEDQIFKQEIEALSGHNSALRVNNMQLNKEIDLLKNEVDRLKVDNVNLKSSFQLSLHSRHTYTEINIVDLNNRFIKIMYEDLLYQQKVFAENTNNRIKDLNSFNIGAKHKNIIIKGEKISNKLLNNIKLTNMGRELEGVKNILTNELMLKKWVIQHREYNLLHQKGIIANIRQELYDQGYFLIVCEKKLLEELNYIDYLESVLVQEETGKEYLTKAVSTLEKHNQELRQEASNLLISRDSREYIYHQKLSVGETFVYHSYPIQIIAVEEGNSWIKHIKQIDRVDDDGVKITGEITDVTLPLAPTGTYKRGEIVDAKYYMAPSSTESTILIVNLEDLSHRIIDLIPDGGEGDTSGQEIMECTSMHNSLGVCCKENGFIYSYNFDDYANEGQVPVFYYHLTKGTKKIATCKGTTDEHLAIGDGQRVFLYTKGETDVLFSKSADYVEEPYQEDGDQGQMIQIDDQSVLIPQDIFYIIFNYVKPQSSRISHSNNPTSHNYHAATPITRDNNIKFALARHSTDDTDNLSIDLLSYNSPTDSHIQMTKVFSSPCSQPNVYLMKELEPARSIILYIRNTDDVCHQLCVYNYVQNSLMCKNSASSLSDIILSPFGY